MLERETILNKFSHNSSLSEQKLKCKNKRYLWHTARKMKFPIKDFSSKCDQIADLVTFTTEILNGKPHFCAVTTFIFFIPNFESYQWPLTDSGFQLIQNSMYSQSHYSDELMIFIKFMIFLEISKTVLYVCLFSMFPFLSQVYLQLQLR